ncbi:hypothetical protein A3E15_02930 [Candidatus Woesebacteria bacterium RIFCSPHIGHO2_12_FULL_42_9]|uniref:Cell division protein FtsL n=3 Tax=Candidatus Woeseibacteriota TaxID=1752722 RepID=A0A1F8AVA7_9BACT|nr:MAG: hypothetical protein UV56_C0017G0007 [Candidatus Woesebacteria bacterium GW2011_GWC1_43_10b]OGM04031.1 MAG: hypothetical protein A2112_01530 [Candidatus Woesebacteria bacterium GWA1_42_12]OGM55693.1 MAG: hypothetical protein A3E15_02930 [Candidatus Woesebacteria bacterium RIFCSPHIGHO2_12_FULL_42_9]
MKQINKVKGKRRLAPFWMVTALFLIATVFFTIEKATEGAELARLTTMEKTLQEEQRRLTSELMQYSSLTNLEERALDLGFAKPVKVIYVLDTQEVAKVPLP